MIHDDAWMQTVRSTLRQAADDDSEASAVLAEIAISRGTRRAAARTSTTIAAMGLLFALFGVFGAYRWAEFEASRMAAATISRGVSWTP